MKKEYDGLVGDQNNDGEMLEVSYIDKINPFKSCDGCTHLMIGHEKYCRKCKKIFEKL